MGEIALLGLVASSQTSKNFRNLEDLPSGKDSQLENPPFFADSWYFVFQQNPTGMEPGHLSWTIFELHRGCNLSGDEWPQRMNQRVQGGMRV